MQILFVFAGVASILACLFAIGNTRGAHRVIKRMKNLRHAIHLGLRLIDVGVYDFYTSRNVIPKTKDFIVDAKKEIGIMGISLNLSVVYQNLHEDIGELIKQNSELEIHVFLLNPRSPFVKFIALASGRKDQEVREYINQSLVRLKSMYLSLGPGERRRCHISLYNFYTATSMLVVDPDEPNGRYLIENHAYGLPIEQRYSIECKRGGSEMYGKFAMTYEALKRDSVEIVSEEVASTLVVCDNLTTSIVRS